jgi:chemotaxis-related protein WspB
MLVLAFQIGSERMALDVRRVREVVPLVRLQPVAGSPAWLAGVFVYRGQIVPVVDLHRLAGGTECPRQLSTRIILVPRPLDGQERLLGLLASQVAEVREMEPPRSSSLLVETDGANGIADPSAPGRLHQPGLGPISVDKGSIVRLLDLDRFLSSFRQYPLENLARELPR